MCTYLAKRGATYYFRRVIPVELRPALNGRAEFMLSLKTKDRETAKRLIPAKTAATDRLLEDARTKLARGAPEKPAQRHSAHGAALERAAFEASLEAAEIAFQEGLEKEARHDAREPLRQRLLAAFENSTAMISPEEAAMRDLLRDVQTKLTLAEEHLLSAKVRQVEERRGVVAPSPTAIPSALLASGDSGIPLTADDDTRNLVDLWAAERRPAQKTVAMHRSDARWLSDRIGRKPVDQITRQDILAFKAKLLEEGQSPTNIKNKLSRLRTLLKFAADNGYAASNVAVDVTIKDASAGTKKRLPFDLAALNAIFAGPVHAKGERPTQGRGEGAYWIPLLALFTGARLEELGQLRPEDVQHLDYADPEGAEKAGWFIRITVKAGRLKNAASERLVPVHPELERLGFVRFAEAMKQQQRERLFHQLTKGPHGNLTHKWGQWFGEYLRKVCKVTDTRMVFHSFRHTFTDYARRPEIPEGVQRRLVGHGAADVHDEYGGGYALHWLVEGMRHYKVPGLKLPH